MAPKGELRAQTLACLHEICGDDFGLDLALYHRHPELTERLKKILIAVAAKNSDKEALTSLGEATRIADFPLSANLKDYGQSLATFDAFSGYLNVLPGSAPSPLALRTETRNLGIHYPQILGVESPELTKLLSNRIEILVRPPRAQALAQIQASLATLENWRGPEFAKDLELLMTMLESIQIMVPYSDGLALDTDAGLFLSPAALTSKRALAVAMHETAHVISHFAAKNPRSSLSLALQALRERLAALNPVAGGRYAEEDWADYFSAKLSGENMACDYVSLAVKNENLSILPSDPDDEHSSIVYRVLAIERAAHGSLPKTCDPVASYSSSH